MSGMYKSIRLYLFLMLINAAPAIAGDLVVATGDDFVVYSRDIDVLKDVYGTTGFETTSKEYTDAMLKVRLFAKEALALKIGGPLAADDSGALSAQTEMTVDVLQKLLQMYGLYVSYTYDRYPVSDAAIESYYLAFPEKTTRSGELLVNDFFRTDTLDEEMKKMIRTRLIQNIKPRLLADEFRRLSVKYHVKVLSGY